MWLAVKSAFYYIKETLFIFTRKDVPYYYFQMHSYVFFQKYPREKIKNLRYNYTLITIPRPTKTY